MFSYAHLQTSCDLEQTINAKITFEKVAATYYHANNGHFECQGFRNTFSEAVQTVGFCDIGAHHQNGIVENNIRLLTRCERTSLLRTKKRWPQIFTTVL